jgi:hypothetical protein
MGMIVLFVTSVMTMMTVESAFNVIWRVRKPRPFAQRVLVYWAIITLGPILIGVSLSISSYLFTRSMAFSAAQHITPVIDWALTGAALPLTVLAFTMLYVYLPNCRVEWRDAVVGGLGAAIAFELAKRGFRLLHPAHSDLYGGVRRVCRGADVPALDVSELVHHAGWGDGGVGAAGDPNRTVSPAALCGQQSVRCARNARAALRGTRSGQAGLHAA